MIKSAQYVADENGDNVVILVVLDNGDEPTVPVNGSTWLNTALIEWQEDGGIIAPAS